MTDFGQWTLEYLELVETKRKLKEFVEERYEVHLRAIARAYAAANAGTTQEPCHDCRVEVSSLIEPTAGGWYFEWNCAGGYSGFGCTANGEGWYVPLTDVSAHLASAQVT
jgi:hypothetical protein